MARTSRTSPVCLVHLVSLMQPHKPDRPNRPNEQDGLADFFSILLDLPIARSWLSMKWSGLIGAMRERFTWIAPRSPGQRLLPASLINSLIPLPADTQSSTRPRPWGFSSSRSAANCAASHFLSQRKGGRVWCRGGDRQLQEEAAGARAGSSEPVATN